MTSTPGQPGSADSSADAGTARDDAADANAAGPAEPGEGAVESGGLVRLLRRAQAGYSGGLARTLSARLVQARLGLASSPTVGRYTIERKLGAGGMGTVFLARDPHLDRALAVKVLNPRTDALEQSRLAQEARALARLNHENVLIVHDVGAEDGQLWIAMEYVAGGTLRQWRHKNLDASWVHVVRLALAAARGLAAAHRADVVHRDFKPDNVMVGDDGRVRVADFGLALVDGARHDAMDPPDPNASSQPSDIEGTPVYMPPEVKRGDQPSPAGDQYSFFVSLRELLDAPGSSQDPTPAPLDAIISRGVVPDPVARWPSMDAAIERLEALVAAPPPDPRRARLLERVQRIWLDGGVQSTALSGGEPVVLDLTPVSGVVDSPWGDLPGPAPRGHRTTATLRLELWRAHGSLLLLGSPGAGKTTALLSLTRDLLERARDDANAPVPVVLNLASLSTATGSLLDWLVDELVTKYGLPRGRALAWLEDDALVLMLDGLDEVVAHRRRAVVDTINAFRVAHPTSMVIACRDATWGALGVKLRVGAAFRIEPPSDHTLGLMCAAHGADQQALWNTLADPAAQRPSPLIVTLWLRAGAAPSATMTPALGLPASGPALPATSVYDAFVARALDRPPPLSPRARARLVEGLAWLAATLRRAGTADLWLERLQADWLPTLGQRRAAQVLGLALMAAIFIVGNLAVNAIAGRTPIVGLLLGGVSVPVAVLLNRGLRVHPREPMRWSWRASLRRVPLVVVLGVGVGLLLGTVFITWVNIILALAGGLALAVALGLEPRDREARIRAAQGLRQSLNMALLVGVGTGLLAGAAVGYGAVSLVLPHVGPESLLHTMDDPRLSLFLSAGGFIALLAGSAHGGTAVTLHAAVRLVIAARSPLPVWLATWLDRAADRGLLRRVGGGWMFLHQTLMDHFLAHPDGAEASGPQRGSSESASAGQATPPT